MGNPTFPCESCGTFHSASEVSDAGGYCPQCDADYDERKMFSDLVSRYAALEAENAKLRAELEFLRLNQRAFIGTLLRSFPLLNDDGLDETEHHCEWHIQQERKRLHTITEAARITMLAAAPSAPKADDPVKQMLLEALEGMVEYFPEGSSDGECFSVDAARAAIDAARKGEGE